MRIPLDGKVALVTGAGRGIGRTLARTLADCGATVIATARTAADLQSLAEQTDGGTIIPVTADVANADSVRALFETVGEKVGRLDILINNAGIGIYEKIIDMPVEEFDEVIAVNLRGAFLCCQQAMRIMTPARNGYIINISSVVGIKGYPNQGAYTASKHGMMGLTKTLAVEAAESGIRVSTILPGGVDTEMVANARPDLDRSILIKTEDIATTVLYLLSLSERAHVDQIYIRRRTGQPF